MEKTLHSFPDSTGGKRHRAAFDGPTSVASAKVYVDKSNDDVHDLKNKRAQK